MGLALAYLEAMLSSVWRHRRLIATLAKRDVQSRYRGSVMGLAWMFLNPIILLCTYTFVFSVVFKAKWNTEITSKTEFAMIIFSGMIAYNLFAECLLAAPMLIVGNANYVKKVVFPLEILSVVSIVVALFHAMVSLGVWLAFYILFVGRPHASCLLAPLAAVPLLLYTAGFSWLLASLGVYLRDIAQVVGLALTALMFLSPIFYPLSALPEGWRMVMSLNPLTGVIEQMRNLLLGQGPLDLMWFVLSCLGGLVVAVLGFAWFQKTRKGFADVI